MNIRRMTIADYDGVYNLWMTSDGVSINSVDDTRDGLSKFLDRNPEICFVAEEGNEIIGTILVGYDGKRGYIYHTAVSPNYRNQGVGRALVNAALDASRKIGMSKIALIAYKNNEMGNAFWDKLGFAFREDLVYRDLALTEMSLIKK